jgi:hypothetical protein
MERVNESKINNRTLPITHNILPNNFTIFFNILSRQRGVH